jgi:hypothetical protein
MKHFEVNIGKYWEKNHKQIMIIPTIMLGYTRWPRADKHELEHNTFRIVIDWLCFYIEFNWEWNKNEK